MMGYFLMVAAALEKVARTGHGSVGVSLPDCLQEAWCSFGDCLGRRIVRLSRHFSRSRKDAKAAALCAAAADHSEAGVG